MLLAILTLFAIFGFIVLWIVAGVGSLYLVNTFSDYGGNDLSASDINDAALAGPFKIFDVVSMVWNEIILTFLDKKSAEIREARNKKDE